MVRFRSLVQRDEGQDVVEYALLASLISIFALITIKAIGPAVNSLYETIKTKLTP